jgi:prepilin-type processing-associated H-X9-DG protein
VLICPTTKFWLNRVQDSAVTNTSYAVNLFAKHGETTVPLLTDANISKQWRELREFPKTAAEVDVGYTFERHQALCNISYGDSHVESKKRLRIERPAEGPSRVVRPVR